MSSEVRDRGFLLHPKVAKRLAGVLRLGVAWVFVRFAWGKLFHPEPFAESIFQYQLLPDTLINIFALFLPWLEFWCALALFVPAFRQAAMRWLVFLLVVFTAAKTSAYLRGLDISCGCTGTGGEGEFITLQSIAFNLLILAGCGIATFLERVWNAGGGPTSR